MAKADKQIVLLDDVEHVLLRPEIYVSSTIESDEVIHYLNDNSKIRSKTMSFNIGMYKLLWEIFDNAVDEIKRVKAISKVKAKKKHIVQVVLEPDTNSITIKDNGDGFYEAIKKNPKSGVTNIETAFCYLKSGSNFKNEERKIQESLIGTNGVGASLVNMLSDRFSVESINSNSKFGQTWYEFNPIGKPDIKNGRFSNTGTAISFTPRKKVFGDSKYNKEIIKAQLAFRKRCMMLSPDMENIDIMFYVIEDDQKVRVNLPTDIFDSNSYIVEHEDFLLAISPLVEGEQTSDFMMVNSTQCNGSPVRYVQEILSDQIFKHEKAKEYYRVNILMNLPPDLVKFGDQNKTQYKIPINKIRPVMDDVFNHRNHKFIYRFPKSETHDMIKEDIDRLDRKRQKKELEKDKRKNKTVNKKYFPASKKKEFFFMVEGDSAAGSIVQGRDPQNHGVYALQGKIQNCRKVSDLRNNDEIMDLISILDLDFESGKSSYSNIVITTDFDPDGIGHIAPLIINFFHRWYPEIIKKGKLFIYKVPLAKFGSGKSSKYVYSLAEMRKEMETGKKPIYLKGLGALDIEDWDVIMKQMHLMQVKATPESMRYLDMAFGTDSDARKEWLNEVTRKS